MDSSRIALFCACLTLAVFSACSEGGGAGDASSDGDADADADSDVDGDTDADTDSDTDGDVDSDSDTDGDVDSDSDTDGDVDSDSDGSGGCFDATRLWFEDFETGDYSRWTSSTYSADWHDGFCHDNGFSEAHSVSVTHSHRSEITCASDESHRGYGGVQFDGDAVVPAYTNEGTGIDAPHGVVNTFWSWIDVPYSFGGGRWFSFWTVNSGCGWDEQVVTLGLENDSNVLTPAHVISTGGTVDFADDPPAMPIGAWARITIYINYHEGVMHVWQDGETVCHGTFSRPTNDICQWHWGAYASGDNTDIVLFEDDNSIWKLGEPWTDFDQEPYFGVDVATCGGSS